MKKKNLLVAILILTMITMFSIPMAVFAIDPIPTSTGNGIVPVYFAGNDNTGDFKIEGIPENKDYDIVTTGGINIGKIVISNATNKTFDWTFENVQGYITNVTSINIKAGDGYFTFDYAPNGATSDTLLFSPKNQNNEGEWADISHVSFFFSTQTTPAPTEGTITVTKDVIYAGHPGLDLYDPQGFAYTYISEDDETISGSGIVSEATSSSITLPFGKYTFTETEVAGYTGVTTNVSVTLSKNNLDETVEFFNSIPEPTEGTITVTKDVIYEGGSDINPNDSHPFNFTYVKSNNFLTTMIQPLLSGSGIVSEISSPSITLPFGTYIFTETEENNYTGVTTNVSVTINKGNSDKTIEFVNSKPVTATVTINKNVPNINNSSEVFDVTIYKTINIKSSETTLVAIEVVQISEIDPYVFEVTEDGIYTFVETPKAGYTTSDSSFELDIEVGPDNDETIIFVNTKDTTTTTTTTTTHHHRDTTIPTPTVIVEPEVPLAETPVVTPEAVVIAPVVTPEIPEEPVPLADVVPQTSDAGNIWLLLALMLGSVAGIATFGRRKETE